MARDLTSIIGGSTCQISYCSHVANLSKYESVVCSNQMVTCLSKSGQHG